ncbi:MULTISPECIES: DUF3140 domain-containing protein [unclassified Roseitalea]|uniref:DUF3140 domain-containing protein n=1 Tax=unclassified Roseitalea TaxID=2639107 RepID=UPI00273DC902|nr:MULTISPECIES: DUF3140 domain-containing protein [unclassified Roseitalea]
MTSSKPREQIWREWRQLVNMSADEIDAWLDTKQSRSVGIMEGDDTNGRKSARRIVEIERTGKDELSDEQWDHMARVVGYIKRHCAQTGPDHDVETSDWRYSLMNWGHDPLKDGGCA